LHRSKNPAAIAHLPGGGKGGRRDEAGGTVRAGTTSSLCGGKQSAGKRRGALGSTRGRWRRCWRSRCRQGIGGAGPPARPKLDPFLGIIDRILEEDKGQPAKQRQTEKRIYERLRDEHGYDGGITIVRGYVHEQRQRLREMFVPLRHDPGHAQVAFGEALAVIAGEQRKIHFFAMDLPHSDACLVQAYLAESTEAFCEGHNIGFEFFGGVPQSILHDNWT
jgi:hypothetical protein